MEKEFLDRSPLCRLVRSGKNPPQRDPKSARRTRCSISFEGLFQVDNVESCLIQLEHSPCEKCIVIGERGHHRLSLTVAVQQRSSRPRMRAMMKLAAFSAARYLQIVERGACMCQCRDHQADSQSAGACRRGTVELSDRAPQEALLGLSNWRDIGGRAVRCFRPF